MKNLKFIAAGLIMLLGFTTQAQIGAVTPSGVVHASVTTNTGPILVAGSFTTNIPVHAAYMLPIPKDGWGIYLRTGGTNAADTTNLVAVFEGVIFPSAGVTQVVDTATITLSTPTTATALPTGYDYLTNFPAASSGLASVLGRCDAIRLRSLQNTNLNSIWVSNLFQVRAPVP